MTDKAKDEELLRMCNGFLRDREGSNAPSACLARALRERLTRERASAAVNGVTRETIKDGGWLGDQINHAAKVTAALEIARNHPDRVLSRYRGGTGAWRDDLARLRADGWSVAVHNDYRLNGKPMTFWLMTHPDGRYAKGEGENDTEALKAILAPAPLGAQSPSTQENAG